MLTTKQEKEQQELEEAWPIPGGWKWSIADFWAAEGVTIFPLADGQWLIEWSGFDQGKILADTPGKAAREARDTIHRRLQERVAAIMSWLGPLAP